MTFSRSCFHIWSGHVLVIECTMNMNYELMTELNIEHTSSFRKFRFEHRVWYLWNAFKNIENPIIDSLLPLIAWNTVVCATKQQILKTVADECTLWSRQAADDIRQCTDESRTQWRSIRTRLYKTVRKTYNIVFTQTTEYLFFYQCDHQNYCCK